MASLCSNLGRSGPGPPQTSRDLWAYPLCIMEKLFNDPLRGAFHQRNFFRVMRFGVFGSTTFSGYDAPREAMRLMVSAVQKFTQQKDPIPVAFCKSCDIERSCLDLLVKFSQRLNGGQSCVFKDILSRVPEAHLAKLHDLVPPSNASKKQKEVAYTKLQSYMAEHSADIFSMASTSPCQVHVDGDGGCKSCRVRLSPQEQAAMIRRLTHVTSGSADVDDDHASTSGDPLSVSVAGSICTGWTSVGKREGNSHTSEILHAVWREERVAESRLQAEHGFFHECTAAYPYETKLWTPLATTHWCKTVRADPKRMGHPARRPRVLTAGFNHRVRWLGQDEVQADFDRLFSEDVMLLGDEYFMAESDDVRSDQQALAKNRKVWMKTQGILTGSDHLDILAPGSQRRWKAHDEYRQILRPSPSHVADIMQNRPDRGGTSVPGPLWPTQLTGSVVWSWRRQRVACKMEHLAAMGVHAFDAEAMSEFGISPIAEMFRDMPRHHVIRMCGNGMHLATQLAWMAYVFCNIAFTKDLLQFKRMKTIVEWDEQDQADTDKATEKASTSTGSHLFKRLRTINDWQWKSKRGSKEAAEEEDAAEDEGAPVARIIDSVVIRIPIFAQPGAVATELFVQGLDSESS